jgi:fructose-1,6-bisphosphatase I
MQTTIEAHLQQQLTKHSDITSDLTNILYDIVVASKIIRQKVVTAGLSDMLGEVGNTNVHGEDVKKLDIFANDTIKNILGAHGRFALLGSEEEEEVITPESKNGEYVMLFDPLDGSSNIDVNVSVGTIFSIYKVTNSNSPSPNDCLKPGSEQVAAGYVIYGSSVVLVYTSGHGVHSFTYDPTIGEFLLTESHIKIPAIPRYYSINEGNFNEFLPATKKFLNYVKGIDENIEKPLSARYVGSLVADFHRNLLKGGIFLYPSTKKSPNGKLRLLYEANPLAFICEQAGGIATDGKDRILDKKPTGLHERTSLIIGNSGLVNFATTLHLKTEEVLA